jgi:recombination protein RecR
MKYPQTIQNLIEYFSKLPTVGPKTAERYVFYLLKQPDEILQKFAQAIAELREKTTICGICGAVAEKNPCTICSDVKRDHTTICIVSSARNMLSLEVTGVYRGVYHVLDGLINTLEHIGPEQLNIRQLLARIEKNKPKEIILDGETTALYLSKLLAPYRKNGLSVTRLAKGLPTGAEMEYADEMTLSNALRYRYNINN